MLDKIKKIQGINHSDFDSIIETFIESAKLDLKSIGIVDTLVEIPNSMIETAIITYVLSFMDVSNADMYTDSYMYQKDTLRHLSEYTQV